MKNISHNFSDFDYTQIQEIPEQVIRLKILEKRLKKLVKKQKHALEVGLGNGDTTILLTKYFRNITSLIRTVKFVNK